jgi:ABC-2 type transport system permease protein
MASANVLQPVEEKGWRQGYGNLLRQEHGRWWRTGRWWQQSLLWLLIVNGILAVGIWVVPVIAPEDAGDLTENLGIFMQLMAFFPMFSVIIITQGALVSEKESGTAAWILSAPVSRSAFILAKLVGNAFGFLVTIILLQGAVAYVQLSLSEGSLVTPGPFLASLGLLSLYLLFYLTLTLMLGAFFDSRGPVLGIAIGVAVASMLGVGQLFAGFLPWLTLILPEALPGMVSLIVQGEALPSVWPIPVVVMALYSLLFVALAIWRFSREEF